MSDDTKNLTDADIAYKVMCHMLDYRTRNQPLGTPGESADSAHAQAAKDLQDAWKHNR